jgi:MYND finger
MLWVLAFVCGWWQEVYKTVAITDNKFGISVGLSSYAVPDTLRGSVAAVECANCGGAGSVRCGRCKRVRYCGSDCQQSHWKIHKMVCGKQ